MAVEKKTEWFGYRTGISKAKKIRQYSDLSGIRPTDLARRAIDEFMANHPISEPHDEPS